MSHRPWHILILLAWLLISMPSIASAQRPRKEAEPSAEISAEETRERTIIDRFVTLLEKNPRRGTALDRIYGYHVERGSIDAFLKPYQDRVAKDPEDGAAWLILGLFESQRGRDAAAVAAFKQAEAKRAADPLPCYYLGQALILTGQPEAAAEALERAIARKPTRADMLEIYQALGRSYQRTRQNEKALAVWNRLEAQFPNDLRVKEQVADALAEEAQPAQALTRYEALAKAVKDKYRQVRFQMEAAELKVRLARSAEALDDFERMLGQLNPDSWLYREVRRKIEEVFLRNDDLAGLAAYYERWIKKTPDDVEAFSRLGKTLANQGRTADALVWFEKAVKLAPSRRELRKALIDQLIQDGKYADASKQYEEIHKADPKNLDVVREWGQVLLKDETKPEAARKQTASEIWIKLTEGKEPDPLIVSQVADLFRQAEMPDQAINLYKKAIALAPEATQYREYLGEFLHTLKRPDEAKAVWGEIAAGSRHNAKNLARLGEVLAGFGYRKEAVDAFAEACKLDDNEYDLRVKYADALFQLDRHDDTLAQLDAADKLATDPEQSEAVLERRIKTYQAANALLAQADALQKELDGGKEPTATRWLRLARYLEAEQKPAEASSAIKKAMQADPKSVPVRTAASRIFEMGGDLGAATEVLKELTRLDRRGRSGYFASLAKLEARLGRREAALAAGRELLAASPGNPETYQDYSDLCFQLGEVEEGLDALRRSVRANPSDPKVALTLAEALARQFRTDEAIELFWRAFEKSAELDAKVGVIARLTELYLLRNQFDRLVSRLERLQAEPDKQREMSLCLAQAYASAGDLGTARQELERLLATNARDAQILGQLSTLSESESDLAAAVKFQKQLVEITPTEDAQLRLAQLHLQAGEGAEAEAIWSRLAASDKDSARSLQAVDSLLGANKREAVLTLTDRLIRRKPDDWEALFREGLALSGLNRDEEAARRFRSILELHTNDDEIGALAKSRMRNNSNRPAGALPTTAAAAMRIRTIPLQDRVYSASQARMAVGLDNRYSYGLSSNYVWSPFDYGQARMAALAWLYHQAEKSKAQDNYLKEQLAARDKNPGDPRLAWDWYLLQLVLQDQTQTYDAAKELAHRFPSDPSALWVYLNSLSSRTSGTGVNVRMAARAGSASDPTPALSAEELDQVVSAFQGLRKRRPDWIQGTVLPNVLVELKRAKRTEQETAVYREELDTAQDPGTIASLIQAAGTRGDVDALIALIDRSEKLQANRTSSSMMYYSPTSHLAAISQTISARGDAKSYADIPRLIDQQLLIARRARQSGKRNRTAARSSANVAISSRIVIYQANGQARSMQVDYPTPNAYLDQSGISTLRNAFDIYKRDDLLSDLLGYYRKRAEKAESAQDRLDASLVLSALDWWDENKDTAVADLKKAVEFSGGDNELALALAALYERQGEPDEAMATLDGIEALDNTTVQNRELAALRLAVSTGNLDRARLACDRLFGLRLDAATQTMLAGQMHQLGMHDQAESVLARAQRRAGQQTSTLVVLMSEYQRQDKADQATQIASQILRRGNRRTLPPGYYNEEESARDEAIRVLGRSGKLKELIARLEAQAERSPKSLQILQSLADYYRAANDRAKEKATYDRIIKIKPDDAKLRFQLATQLSQTGDFAAAVEHIREAVKQEPMLLANNGFDSVMSIYRQARKMEELATLLDSIDLKSISQPYYVGQILQGLLADPKTKDQGRKLLKKAWDVFADQRSQIMAYLDNNESWWNEPEAYEMCVSALIPNAAKVRRDPWTGLYEISMYQGDGRIVGMLTRVISAAKRLNKLDELGRQVDESLKQFPQWSGGKAMSAILLAHSNRVAEARARLKDLLDEENKGVPTQMRWVVAQELEDVPSLQEDVVKLYEREIKDSLTSNNRSNGLQYNTPILRLIAIYKQTGRSEQARNWLRKLSEVKPDYSGYPIQYLASQKANDLNELAAQMLQLDATIDAVRLYGEMFEAAANIPADSNYYPSRENATNMAQQGLEQAFNSIKADALGACFAGLLEPKPNPKPGEPQLNLMLGVRPRALDRAAVFSLADVLIAATTTRPEARAAVQASLAKAAERAPDDISVQVGLALVAFASGSAEGIDQSTKNLADLMAKTPLENLPAGTRANARQREEAARQMGLWLVARACWTVDSVRDRGDVFATRAFEAAQRQVDTYPALAMLREWGQVALDRGDRPTAEARWSRMLAMITVKPTPAKSARKPARPDGVPVPAPAPAPAAPAPARPTVGVKKVSQLVVTTPAAPQAAPSSISSLTSERFEQAAQLAKLAAEKGMNDLSLRAVREAIKSGPPMNPTLPDASMSMSVRSRRGMATTSANAADPLVERQLTTLVPLWKRSGVTPAQIYEILRDAVLPESRPQEVFLYAQPLANPESYGNTSLPEPRNLGSLLVQAAIDAKQTDDLRKVLEPRRGQLLAEPSASVLLSLLGIGLEDDALAGPALDALVTRLQRDSLLNSATLACQVAIPALGRQGLAPRGEALLEAVLKHLGTQPEEEPRNSLQRLLARHWFAKKELEKGRRLLEQSLSATEGGLAASRNNVDYVFYRRKMIFANFADEYARAGQVDDALDLLGRYSDLPQSRYNYGDSRSLGVTLVRQISQLPAAERYERLKVWTLPTASRTTVRLLGESMAYEPLPAIFTPQPIPSACFSDSLSTADLLLEAAKEAGKLDDLDAELQKAVEKKQDGAEMLWLLTRIARGQADTVADRLTRLADEYRTKLAEKPAPDETNRYSPSRPTYEWPAYLVAKACLADPKLAEIGERMGKDLVKLAFPPAQFDANLAQFLQLDLAESAWQRAAGQGSKLDRDPGLLHWPNDHLSNSTQGGWALQDGLLSSFGGTPTTLRLGFPVAGTFTFSFDAFLDDDHGAGIAYGGLNVGVQGKVKKVPVQGEAPSVRQWVRPGAFNRITIAAEPEKVRALVNGHVIQETNRSADSAPWLGFLHSPKAVYRNPEFSGSPEIPRSVSLLSKDWTSYWHSLSYRDTIAPQAEKNPSLLKLPAPPVRSEDYDWALVGDEIVGRKVESLSGVRKVVQSALAYIRPFQDGETLKYQFYYEPGQVAVHPAIGRLAFLLEPEGVRLHWITKEGTDDWTGIEPNNAVDVPGDRRGPSPLPLKAKEWNAIKLALADGKISITLNDALIYERPLEPENSRTFAFYHEKDRTQVRVRGIVREGAWPEFIPAELFARKGEDGPPELRRARLAVIGEEALVKQADQVLKRAAAKSPAERYEMLAAWVLPGEDHATFRLQGDLTPADPAPPVASGKVAGGSVVAPALELVAEAKALGKLPELLERARGFGAKSDQDRRGQLAIEALILAAQGNDAAASATLERLNPLLAKVPADAPEWQRWPEIVAVAGLPESLRQGKAALALLDALADAPLKLEKDAIPPRWLRHARHERALVQAVKPGGSREITGWLAVAPGSAEARGSGLAAPFWTAREGLWTRSPGEADDSLIFRTPLKPPFVLAAELRASDQGQTMLSYGGMQLGLNAKGTALLASFGSASLPDVTLPEAAKGSEGWRAIRIEAKDAKLIVSVDGARVCEQALTGSSDPWLAIATRERGSASIRNVAISGEPTVPESIDLGDSLNLAGWSARYYDEATAGPPTAWEKRGDEILGARLKPPPDQSNEAMRYSRSQAAVRPERHAVVGSRSESLVRYHTPLREDGSIECEFFYEPGQTLVHPALGRLAFILAPKGVSLHWLTDGEYDRTGLAPGNETPDPSGRRGPEQLPLKAGDWNRLKLTVEGNKVGLILNDVPIYERELEADNSRLFGFFHYAEETDCRIRNVQRRGNWPRSLGKPGKAAR
ncbi:DUF1583 domain-containing protein [Singulisphaera sp. PoT]|uniref:DUF1583 domain-containing protein n=1 Tax=Singulisphaera sp. PoT TaxID=3411797 RepID=UPI003BF5D0DA